MCEQQSETKGTSERSLRSFEKHSIATPCQ